jgi:hypothetical protein
MEYTPQGLNRARMGKPLDFDFDTLGEMGASI